MVEQRKKKKINSIKFDKKLAQNFPDAPLDPLKNRDVREISDDQIAGAFTLRKENRENKEKKPQ